MSDINKQLATQRLDDNITARLCIHSKYLKLEPELQDSKWFAYRFMSPLQATRKFALAYNRHYEWAFARHFDRNAKVRAVDWTKFGIPSQLMTQLWGARQNADKLGIQYDDYLEFFDEFNMRRTRKQLPRPNQIEGSAAAKRVWPGKLAAFQSERAWHQLVRLEVPQLHVQNFRNHPAQVAFRAWAMEVVHLPGRTFAQAMEQVAFRQCVVPPEAFRSVMEEDVHSDFVRRFEDDCKRRRIIQQPAETLSSVSFWPSCFALLAPNASACAKCPFRNQCRKMNDYTAAKIAASPSLSADDLKRKNDRERQARCREKKNTSGLTS